MVGENLSGLGLNVLGTQIGFAIKTLIQQHPYFFALIILAAIWKTIWYAIALYKSGSKKQKAWFIVLLICFAFLNDLGIVAIVYVIYSVYQEKHVKHAKYAKYAKLARGSSKR